MVKRRPHLSGLRSIRGGLSAPYHPNRRKLIQISWAGFSGTLVTLFMSAMLYIAGWSSTDFGALFGSFLVKGDPPLVSEPAWWVGLTIYLILGAFVFPIGVDYLAARKLLTNHRWTKGLAAGFILWFVAEALLKPLAGMGFFSNRLPASFAATLFSLALWLSYALIFEKGTRVRLVHDLRLVEAEAA